MKYEVSVYIKAFATVTVEAASEAEAKSNAMTRSNWNDWELQEHTAEPDSVESVREMESP